MLLKSSETADGRVIGIEELVGESQQRAQETEEHR